MRGIFVYYATPVNPHYIADITMNLIKKCTVLLCLTLFHNTHTMLIPVAAAATKAVAAFKATTVFVAPVVAASTTIPATVTTTAAVVAPAAKAAVGITTFIKGAGGLAGLGGLLLAAKKLFDSPTPHVTPPDNGTVAQTMYARTQRARRRAQSVPDRVAPLPPWQADRGPAATTTDESYRRAGNRWTNNGEYANSRK